MFIQASNFWLHYLVLTSNLEKKLLSLCERTWGQFNNPPKRIRWSKPSNSFDLNNRCYKKYRIPRPWNLHSACEKSWLMIPIICARYIIDQWSEFTKYNLGMHVINHVQSQAWRLATTRNQGNVSWVKAWRHLCSEIQIIRPEVPLHWAG